MVTNSCVEVKAAIKRVTMLAAGLVLASCVAQPSPPEQVDSNKPSVTYRYLSDEELIDVNQKAATFCHQYNMAPQPTKFSTDQGPGKIVIFECVQSSMSTSQQPKNPSLNYSYRTDQELLNSSRSAGDYCMRTGLQQVVSDIVVNIDGSRTVTYQCR